MTWIDLGNPSPKLSPSRYNLVKWQTGEVQRLTASTAGSTTTFNQVIEGRKSDRQFGPIDDQQLGALLWQACRCREVWPSDLGFDLEHRSTPSAGAIHPIHVLINKPGDCRWWLYQPQGHYLVELIKASEQLAGLLEHSAKVLEGPSAVRLLFVAEPGKTLTKYDEGCSLVWRDAGALLAILALTAHAQGLTFCPLGITGEPWASALSDQGQLAGVGFGLLGFAARS
ncbi:nitroreductase family protein [Pseudomonas azotoformans]|uniref:nitroreductase family protein n=1 Tax=Pseudomonas azotoformans TaxID=47878 RepID=UPI0016622DDE|nr:nitroreductase family protein [Pseudomonas azotoformans]UMY49286.1 nitroreductase family protein [Pseudomonas azotoformans]